MPRHRTKTAALVRASHGSQTADSAAAPSLLAAAPAERRRLRLDGSESPNAASTSSADLPAGRLQAA